MSASMKDEPEFYALKPLSPTEHVVCTEDNTTKPWFLIAEEHRCELPPITIALFYGDTSVAERWTLYHFDSARRMERYFTSYRKPFRDVKLFLRGVEYELPSYVGPYFMRIDGQGLECIESLIDLHNAFYDDGIKYG